MVFNKKKRIKIRTTVDSDLFSSPVLKGHLTTFEFGSPDLSIIHRSTSGPFAAAKAPAAAAASPDEGELSEAEEKEEGGKTLQQWATSLARLFGGWLLLGPDGPPKGGPPQKMGGMARFVCVFFLGVCLFF